MTSTSIKEIRFNGKEPAVAYTDYTAIYLSYSLIGDELDTARIHELSHIWLQHQLRKSALHEELGKVDNYLWNVAADLEIAKYVYTDKDNDAITRVRSALKGAITTKDCEQFSGEYAEDFYKELLEKQVEIGVSFDANGNVDEVEVNGEKVDVPDVVKKAIQQAVDKKEAEAKSKSALQLHKDIAGFKAPKPSLASEIDRQFGRNKIVRVSSYRRPNRREGDFLLKGTVSKKKAARFTLYVDRSGSFDPSKTAEATQRLAEIVQKYRGKVTQDVIYFNNILLTIDPKVGDGGTNYQAVVGDIIRNKSELSIIITDDDSCQLEFDKAKLPKVVVVRVGCAQTWIARELNCTEVA